MIKDYKNQMIVIIKILKIFHKNNLRLGDRKELNAPIEKSDMVFVQKSMDFFIREM